MNLHTHSFPLKTAKLPRLIFALGFWWTLGVAVRGNHETLFEKHRDDRICCGCCARERLPRKMVVSCFRMFLTRQIPLVKSRLASSILLRC